MPAGNVSKSLLASFLFPPKATKPVRLYSVFIRHAWPMFVHTSLSCRSSVHISLYPPVGPVEYTPILTWVIFCSDGAPTIVVAEPFAEDNVSPFSFTAQNSPLFVFPNWMIRIMCQL